MFSAAEVLEEFVSAAELAPPGRRDAEALSYLHIAWVQERETVALECARCGVTFHAPTDHRAKKGRRQYCSRRCQQNAAGARRRRTTPRVITSCACSCGRSLEGFRRDAKWASKACQTRGLGAAPKTRRAPLSRGGGVCACGCGLSLEGRRPGAKWARLRCRKRGSVAA